MASEYNHRGAVFPNTLKLDLSGRKRSIQTSHDKLFQGSLIPLLNKPPKKRTKTELEVLFSLALSESPIPGNPTFFQKFYLEHGEQSLMELLKNCYYE